MPQDDPPPNSLPPVAAAAEDRATQPDATMKEALNTVGMLLSLGFLDHAQELLEDLIKLPPAGQNTLLQLCRRLRAGEAMKETAGADIMIAPMPRARHVVLLFAAGPGRFQEMGNHEFLRRSDTSYIYLRNRSDSHYLAGIGGLGADYAACVAGFRRIIAKLAGDGPAPIVSCIGHSISGYATLRYALDLGARGVMCTSPYTTLSKIDLPPQAQAKEIEALQALPDLTGPLAPLYRAAAKRPKAVLCYGADNSVDSWMAECMRDVPDVTLLPIPGFAEHNSLIEIMRLGRYAELVEDLLA